MKLIHPDGNGGIRVVLPTGDLPIEAVAFKDVPAGVPYRFVADDYVPSDRTYRSAWEDDFTSPDGIGGVA